MIVTYNWLKEYVDFSLSPEELSHRLTMAGLEVDAMDHLGAGLDSVIVARLETVEPHPQADRLTCCQVNTGSEVIPVVCGATNHRAGDLVALATVGSVLPGDFKIKKSKIRGYESRGMLCSETELGLARESAGILILPPDLPLGEPLFSALQLKDVRYEIGLTPNRADCLSVVGIAREVAAIAGSRLRLPQPAAVPETSDGIADLARVDIDQPDMCPRYMARLIRSVTIGPSPQWLVRRLETLGLRSINNVVDVTNYVLMELGHPLHAFDFNRLRGGRIQVRAAQEGDRFTTLDGQERLLQSGDAVICDAVGPVALAGIMGGENSEINDQTRDVLLESAYFDPLTIRRTSKRLGIHSESSHRFERGADIAMVPLALERAAVLIQQLAGGELVRGTLDSYVRPLLPRTLQLRRQAANGLLGLDLSLTRMAALLESIGLACRELPDERLEVVVPTGRHDLEREVDLVEEIARLHGYDEIPVTLPVSRILLQKPDARQQLIGRVRDQLVAQGASELINYSFVSPTLWDRLQLADDDPRRQNVRILNPLTEEQSVMRTSLVPSMLETLARNLSYRNTDLTLFELRPVFRVSDQDLPQEGLRLCLALTGRRMPEGWAQTDQMVDFFDLKGLIEGLAQALNLGSVSFVAGSGEPFLHPGKSCCLWSGGLQPRQLGVLGELHPVVQDCFELPQPVFIADLDVEALVALGSAPVCFTPISRYPDVTRDSAFLVDAEVPAQALLDVVQQMRLVDLDEVVLFDLYTGSGVPEGKKSLAIRARYRSREKTLTDEEISQMHGRLVKEVLKKLPAQLR
ncbi:phenylalanine--tRNA ligase subunit beta [Desulfuromonas thiophila]|uniref:phenylalanine--tRNA ligase subunit beta n=1 Tax=Desulfuromonas thiophila TaxID=57664 RepID=UPI0029F499A3|nr:phenylalanine--tRNA ligase subunit beta [Desulfuromonas thiophila]